jgi:hypothetical protein
MAFHSSTNPYLNANLTSGQTDTSVSSNQTGTDAIYEEVS